MRARSGSDQLVMWSPFHGQLSRETEHARRDHHGASQGCDCRRSRSSLSGSQTRHFSMQECEALHQ